MIYTDEFAPAASRNALRQVDDLMAADGLASDIWYPRCLPHEHLAEQDLRPPFVGNLQFLYWNRDDYAGALTPNAGRRRGRSQGYGHQADQNHGRQGGTPRLRAQWFRRVDRRLVSQRLSFWGDGTPEQVAIGDPKSLEALQYCVDLYEALGGWDAVGAI